MLSQQKQSKSSPISISTSSPYSCDTPDAAEDHDNVLKSTGLTNGKPIHQNLQESIWRASYDSEPAGTVLIKITHRQFIDKTRNSNILLEQSILKYITNNKHCPTSIVKYIDFIKTNTDYYLITEDGGSQLDTFVQKSHNLIRNGHLELSEWKKVCQIIFKQMVESVHYIHSKNLCHFEIRLQNFVINNVPIKINKSNDTKWKIEFLKGDIHIKLTNFSSAKLFGDSTYSNHRQFVEKYQYYKCPEIINKNHTFDAKKADVFSLGIGLFILMTGYPPWFAANQGDDNFVFIMKYSVSDLLKHWNMSNYVNQNLIYLFDSIFEYESDRIDMNEIKYIFDF